MIYKFTPVVFIFCKQRNMKKHWKSFKYYETKINHKLNRINLNISASFYSLRLNFAAKELFS